MKALTRLAAERDPHGLALQSLDVAWTHGELEARVVDAARRLLAWGVRPGEVVALWGANSLDWVVAFHAVTRVDALALLLSPRLTDVEILDGLTRGEAAHLLADAALCTRARALFPRVTALGGLKDLSAGAHALPDAHAASRPFVRLLTSGTSGRPKVVELSRGAVTASAVAVASALALSAMDRWWAAMPLCHVGGLGVIMRAPMVGAGVLLAPRFTPESVLAPALGATVASFVPTMLEAVLERLDGREWPTHLRVAMLGGAPVSPHLVASCPVALPTYGLSEAASTVTLAPLTPDPLARSGSGVALPPNRVRVLDERGQEAHRHIVGRIQIAGPTLMTRYVGDPAATARALPDGWLEPGDFGHLDEGGRLHIAGRREDLIISGGENVYPAEIEAALALHPALKAVAVVGVPHARWGQAPYAFVVPRPGAVCEASALDAHLAARLARYKLPQAYAFLAELPLLGNGKPDRRALGEAAASRASGVECQESRGG